MVWLCLECPLTTYYFSSRVLHTIVINIPEDAERRTRIQAICFQTLVDLLGVTMRVTFFHCPLMGKFMILCPFVELRAVVDFVRRLFVLNQALATVDVGLISVFKMITTKFALCYLSISSIL